MATPLDELRRYGCAVGDKEELQIVEHVFAELKDAPLLDISNVCDYYYQTSDSGKQWKITDFPNVAPPFHSCWVSSSRFPSAGWQGFVLGVVNRDLSNAEEPMFFDLTDVEYEEGISKEGEIVPVTRVPESVRWMQEVLAIGRVGKQFHVFSLFTNYINQDGSVYLYEGRPRTMVRTFGGEVESWQAKQDKTLIAARLMVYPLFLAISFMHCKNVRVLQDVPPARLAKKWQRKHGFPLVKRYTLQIEPMKQVLRKEGGAETEGLAKALHICRGHFATYSPDKPLFGKYSGTFWKPQHVRGSKEHGEIVKDYAVRLASGASKS